MKRFQVLGICLVSLVFVETFFSARCSAEVNAPSPSARTIVLLPPSSADAANGDIIRWQQRITEKPDNAAYWERLGWAYVERARSTQDAGFYKLAELTAEAWESSCGTSAEAQLLRGHVAHNLHRFSQAETIARALVRERKSPADYALLCDALMEQGKLNEAVEVCQTLANLRPGVESSSRIAHLRWLFGDLEGAVEAMNVALRAADPRDSETRAWLYTRLAGYALLQGNALQAMTYSETALGALPEYPLALSIKGRALYSAGKYETALSFLRRAAELNPIPDNLWWLADALRAQGQESAAGDMEKRLRRFGAATDPRTVSLYLATRGESLDEAVLLATAELKNRADIFTHDALAFALARSGKPSEAAAEMRLATNHQTGDPRLLLHAGILAQESGDRPLANRCYERAKPMAAVLTPSEQALLSSRIERISVASR